jgi:transposase
MNRRSYSATSVRHVRASQVALGREGLDLVVGVDVAKAELVLVARWSDARFERPWKANNPLEVPGLVAILKALAGGRGLVVAMEPTGVYGEALRQALAAAAIPVRRVSPKAAHDFAEVFDGVPSQHDGKDAAVIADLCALGKSAAWDWSAPSEHDQRLAMAVEWTDAQRRLANLWGGKLEALVARHWPEASAILPVSSATLLRALERWGGPAALAADPEAADRLRRWGGRYLSAAKVGALLASARATVGVVQGPVDRERMTRHATAALSARRQVAACRRELARLAEGHAVLDAQAAAVGAATACVLWVCLGDPREYSCGAAYRKAMGLNLAERSSGRYRGKLKIAKRGSAMARHWLHLAALRLVRRSPEVAAWYRAKRRRDAGASTGAVTAVARRLALALHAVATTGAAFDAGRLFPGGRASCPQEGGPAVVKI